MQRQNRKCSAWSLGRFQVFARRWAQARNADPARMPDVLRQFSACLVCLLAVAMLASVAPAAGTSTDQFRIGFSSKTFTDVEENDAMAALKVWAGVIAKERGIPIDSAPRVLNGMEAIGQALRAQVIDAIALNTDEYWKLRDVLDARIFIGNSNEGRSTEEYVLLVHQDSTIKGVENLRGRSLAFFQNSRMSLASIWLDTVLIQAGLPRAAEFCSVTKVSKLAQVVLPVFFRQADACVVTRRSFKTMSELNPQLSRRLKVLASSPELVPSGFCFRRDYNDPLRETIITELGKKIMSTPAGAQVMTLFQSGAPQVQPISCLDSAFELLNTYERLCGGTNTTNSSTASAALDNTQGAAK